jgi:hypothetical protein
MAPPFLLKFQLFSIASKGGGCISMAGHQATDKHSLGAAANEPYAVTRINIIK